jgi:4-carboxymuconolactone decarboxylase
MSNMENKFARPGRAVAAVAMLGLTSVLGLTGQAYAQTAKPSARTPVTADMPVPALEHYTENLLLGDVWKRPGLSPRDRSIVTLAVLVARDQPAELPFYVNRALDHGVKPAEISELITHLAFYAGWPSATAAAKVAMTVFAARRVGADQLPPAKVNLLPLDKAAEEKRARMVEENFGKVAPGVVKYTTEALFRDLWLRPGLAPRDRSIVTVSALVAAGQVAQVTFHLNRAMDSGLSEKEAGEMLTQLAFYAGWPNVFSAMPVFKEVFAQRAQPAPGR